MAYSKADLINKISDTHGITKSLATNVVQTIIETIIDETSTGNDVAIAGLGSFKAADRAARVARNPTNGEEVQVPAKKALVFKAAKAVKEALNS
jgi:DNA-binding protein HU-beta